MNVTINDAMNAFALLRDNMDENSFLYECYNLGISSLKTVQDGNYQFPISTIPREILEEMANYDCHVMSCSHCKYATIKNRHYECMSLKAKHILTYERCIKEVEEWINQNSSN